MIFFILSWLNRSKVNKRGRSPIYLRITVSGVRAELSTGKWIEKDKWSSDAGKVMGRSEEARTINGSLDQSKLKIEKIYERLKDQAKLVSPAVIKNEYLGKGIQKKTLVEVFEEHNRNFEALVG